MIKELESKATCQNCDRPATDVLCKCNPEHHRVKLSNVKEAFEKMIELLEYSRKYIPRGIDISQTGEPFKDLGTSIKNTLKTR